MTLIKKMPVPVCSLALSLAVLGNLLSTYGSGIRYCCGILSLFILFCFSLKVITDRKTFAEELNNPIAFSSLPTYSMALMLLSAYIRPFLPSFALSLWGLALILHFIIMFLFIKSFVLNFKISNVFPSWFIAAVGFVVASVTAPAFEMRTLGQLLFYAGLILYGLILPVILYRMIRIKPLPEPALPTIAIFAAPASLCLCGYLSTFESKNTNLVIFLLLLCLINYLVVLAIIVVKLIHLPFYPTFSAFTFPVVISAMAIKMASPFLTANQFTSLSMAILPTTIIAIVIVIYVLIRYCMFWFTPTPN